ncbi:enoyl-CoA hydratase/isomerase family protein [Sandaracinobacter sp. RS1-74]|uniref:enoyl-CoA hydratase/isomerase family protein n=1 Tax=Sandaracinobacteroides sayramensis TaxID=2913411 RepID=UPI001EDBD0D0|nr:enoyl-CoA hydratase/isomerase family protein [Sandaracinobacteroides sayramensis]MCG2840941.1 enoyl-CoA hydratase/isomerase family protein [Sandaracinobacteroides sayramensis]
MTDAELDFTIEGPIARATINRPHAMNAMKNGMWERLGDHLRSIEFNHEVRVVLITGAGDNFCAGGDVKEFSTTLGMADSERANHWMTSGDKGNQLFALIERIPQPVVARVRGMAAGGGLAMVAAADLAIASENSRFLAAQIRVGVIPDSALSYNLVRNIGPKRAKQIAYLGDIFGPAEALDFGLLNWVVPDADLDDRTEALLARIAALPQEALGRTKRAMNLAHRISVTDHLAQETIDIGAVVAHPDYAERVTAFMTRRG